MDMDTYYWEMVKKNIGVYSKAEQECLRNKRVIIFGLGVLPMNPTILLGVLIGTLMAVLFTKGLPAGLIIAAGIIAINSMKRKGF
ncbi:DUF441 family protein [Bacillus mycoides]|nr:DUF441 family protein [Bacillus mycoides]